jgi:hypothetical protein
MLNPNSLRSSRAAIREIIRYVVMPEVLVSGESVRKLNAKKT